MIEKVPATEIRFPETPWQRDVIDLKMKEYESLRTEVVQRIGARQQMAGYAGAATAVTAAIGGDIGIWRWVLVGAVLLLAAVFLRDSNQGVQRLGQHLRQLEGEINALSQEIYGHPVLTWECRRQDQRVGENVIRKAVGMTFGWYIRRRPVLPRPRGGDDG